MIRTPLENKYIEIGRAAFHEFSKEIHNEIQELLDKLNLIIPVKGISMGMGCFDIDGNISVIDEDGEEYDVPFYEIHNLKSYYRKYIDPDIFPVIDRLYELGEFILSKNFIKQKNFSPTHFKN